MNDRYKRILGERLIPLPRKIDFCDADMIELDKVRWSFTAGIDGCDEVIAEAFGKWWKISPECSFIPEERKAPKDGYFLTADAGSVKLEYSDLNGLRNGLRTLRQIAEPLRTRTISGWLIPQMTIEDYPSAAFRGVHICVFPETEVIELEKQIRLAAFFKLNTVVLELFGTFPFECEPDFCWPDLHFTRDDFRNLVRIGRSLGVSVVPGVNLVGHAPWAIGSKSGKFAVLNFHPEYAPLFDPDGWCWCMSNPATKEVLSKLVNELCDVFENPPYFHIGCDEADDSMVSCRECVERDPVELLLEYLNYFNDLLKSRSCRMMIWHDMMVDRTNPRWAGLTASGLPELNSDDMYLKLPKDIVICDWEYDRPMPQGDYEISKFFKQNGFVTLLCPCSDVPAVYKMGNSVRDNKLDGLLGTTWLRSMRRGFSDIYNSLAHAAWNPDCDFRPGRNAMPNFNTALRYIDNDCGIKDYRNFGRLNHYQQSPDKMIVQ